MQILHWIYCSCLKPDVANQLKQSQLMTQKPWVVEMQKQKEAFLAKLNEQSGSISKQSELFYQDCIAEAKQVKRKNQVQSEE